MGGILSSLLAGISLGLRQPLASFCDVESTHGDHLITKRGEYVSVLRINGLRRMCTRQEVEALAEQQRIELQGLLEERGHAIVGWYISDPERSGIEIDRLSLNGCRSIARQIGADLSDVIEERRRRWPNVMRWEATCYVLWTRPSVLTREDRKQVAEERRTLASQFPRVGNTQRFALRSDIMAARMNRSFHASRLPCRGSTFPANSLVHIRHCRSRAKRPIVKRRAPPGNRPCWVTGSCHGFRTIWMTRSHIRRACSGQRSGTRFSMPTPKRKADSS